MKFDVFHKREDHLDVTTSDVPTNTDGAAASTTAKDFTEHRDRQVKPEPGHCVGCHEPFSEYEMETLVGFACGHVFHLSHLLSFRAGEGERPLTPPDVEGERDDDGMWKVTHSVGAKVTHARLLRDSIRDGCPICSDVVT